MASIERKINRYKIKLFCSLAFCILTAIVILCSVFLICYICGERFYVNLDNATCEIINMILVSLTTGYIASYITYLLSAHIPNYNLEIKNEYILRRYYLWRYKSELIECFSLLVYLHGDNLPKISQIVDIKNFFSESNNKWFYHKYLINEVESSNGKSLITRFEKLINTSNLILSVSQGYKSELSFTIAKTINPEWFDLIQIIQCDLSGSYDNFKLIEDQFEIVNLNFELVKDA